MQKKALVVAGAIGEVGPVDDVLRRFGFGPPEIAPSVDAGIAQLQASHFDLVFVPLANAGGVEQATLERELRQRERTFVVGTAPRAEPDLILQALRSGVHEFLVSPPDPKELAAALDRLMRRGERESSQGTVFAVYSAKGGLGTTSVALNLAFALAKRQSRSRVAVADLVVSGGDLRVLLNLRPSYDIGDLIARMQRIDAELLTSILTPVEGGVWVLPAAESPEVADVADGNAVSTIVGQLRAQFAYSVLDCEHHLTDRTLAALNLADKVLLVTQLNVAALRSAQRTLDLMQRLGYGDDKTHVIVNRHNGGDVVTLNDAADLLGQPIFFHLPNDYRTSSASQAKGVPITTHDPSSRLAQSYAALAAKAAGVAVAPRNGRATTGARIGRLFGFVRS